MLLHLFSKNNIGTHMNYFILPGYNKQIPSLTINWLNYIIILIKIFTRRFEKNECLRLWQYHLWWWKYFRLFYVLLKKKKIVNKAFTARCYNAYQIQAVQNIHRPAYENRRKIHGGFHLWNRWYTKACIGILGFAWA